MSRILILMLISLCLNSCVKYSNISSEHDILVDFHSNNKEISLSDLTIRKGRKSLQNKYFNLIFESALGGGESFLGYTYRNVHADTYRGRFSVVCPDKSKIKLSVEEVLSWPSTVIDNDTILIAPLICRNPQ